ncbi:MAG: SIS domain-containing protein [Candidatus Marinimicrobia bacterium]|nr:SIS domain-containing protein [Candidatus Neomarinimicrobiota bacterium]
MTKHTVEEIKSQPETWDSVIRNNLSLNGTTSELIKNAAGHNFGFIGSGTSYYLSLSAAAMWKAVTGGQAQAIPSADVIFYSNLYAQKGGIDSAVLISRSGTTSEILLAGDTLKKYNTNRISLTCRAGSSLSQMGEYRYLIDNADEKSVVMTRSFTSMLLQLQILASRFSGNQAFFDQLASLPETGINLMKKYEGLAGEIISANNFSKFIYLGHGPHFGLASEGMLKVKEMSIANSEAYHSLEYRHGPMSLVDDDTLIIYLLSDHTGSAETKLIGEMNALGGKSLVICETANAEVRAHADYIVELGSGVEENARLILALPTLQILAYENALKKGMEPDEPRNLTQVVMLEDVIA